MAEEYRRRITAFLNSISRTRNDISLILIAGHNDEVLTHDPTLRLNPVVDIPTREWYRRAIDDPGRAVVSSSTVQNVIDGRYRWVITLSRTINDPATGEEYGVMLVDLNFSVIRSLLSRVVLGPRGYLFVVDAEGGIVYHPRQELIYSELEREYIETAVATRNGSFSVTDEKGERLYTVSTSPRTGWRTVGVNYVSELVQNRRTIQGYYISWTVICIVLAVFVAVLISQRLSMPILRLRSTMRVVEQGNFDVTADITRRDEIGDLARDFNIMIARIKELVQTNAEEQEEKRKSELMALQNQITPHFLYNTLDSIVWMAEGGQNEEVVKMVSALARLLRLSISRGEEFVTIRDEIAHVGHYLTIQKMRYRDKLDFNITVDEEILGLYVPTRLDHPGSLPDRVQGC
ncbi:MAG: histidine kinase [Alkalispirochaeta sp.]